MAACCLLLLLDPSSARAAIYYISTTGSDTNSGSVTAPLATIMQAQSLASSGDTVLLESGTYAVAPIINSLQSGVYEVVNLINKNGITYEAVPGTRPVLNFSALNPTGYRVAAFWVTASNVTFQGFDVTGVQENITTANNQSLAFAIWGGKNCTWNQVNAYNNYGVGFYLEEVSANNLFYQCDSYNNTGINSYSFGNADGFGCHPAAGGSGNIYRQCRSWNNSDDGYDCINASESVTFDHCWSYLNGNNGGNGNGFKVGGWASQPQDEIANPLPVHTVVYCLSAGNSAAGFYANHQPGQTANWWNNTGYGNQDDFNMLERTPPIYSSTSDETDANDIPGVNEVMHYNLAYTSGYTNIENLNETGTMVSNNSWTESITVANSDFQGTVETQMTQVRPASGALPAIAFMNPVNGSPTTGLGCFNAAPALTWTGTSSAAWDIRTANWLLAAGGYAGNADVYCDGATVTFSDAATTGTVALGAGVNPGSVTFSNSSLAYTLNSSSLGISGSAALLKTGSAPVILTGTESYTGGTTISGGTYALGADSSTAAGTVESPGLTGGANASLGSPSSPVLVNDGGELRFGGRGGATVYTYVIPNPITVNGASIYSIDGLQQLTGGLTIGSGGANLVTASSTKNLSINSAWSGSGNVTIDDWQASVSDTSGALVAVTTAANLYDGVITIDAPSTGYLGGILEISNSTALINATIIDNNTAVTGLLFTTATPQIGALGGPGNIPLPAGGTLTAGANGASTICSGILSSSGGLTKTGAGTMILSGSNTYTGATTVTGGVLEITGAVAGSKSLSVSSGAVLDMNGGTLGIGGPITNSGLIKLSGSASMSSTGTFTNNGVLDLINGPQTLPAGFTNNGTVLNTGSVHAQQLTMNGSKFTLAIQGYAQHTYQLQHTASLAPPVTWTNVGSPQTGAGSQLTFTDSAAAGAQGFYQILVSP